MAASIYWDNPQRLKKVSQTRRRRRPATQTAKAEPKRATPWWLSVVIFTVVFGMLLISINYRAFTAMREEASQNTQLQTRVQKLMDENTQLHVEIPTLKTEHTQLR